MPRTFYLLVCNQVVVSKWLGAKLLSPTATTSARHLPASPASPLHSHTRRHPSSDPLDERKAHKAQLAQGSIGLVGSGDPVSPLDAAMATRQLLPIRYMAALTGSGIATPRRQNSAACGVPGSPLSLRSEPAAGAETVGQVRARLGPGEA
jgi:hypothetical protein